MRILLVSQYYYPERFSVTDIAETLVKLGNDVTVLTGRPNYGYQKILDEYKKVKYEVINGVKVHRVSVVPRKYSRISIIRNYSSNLYIPQIPFFPRDRYSKFFSLEYNSKRFLR